MTTDAEPAARDPLIADGRDDIPWTETRESRRQLATAPLPGQIAIDGSVVGDPQLAARSAC